MEAVAVPAEPSPTSPKTTVGSGMPGRPAYATAAPAGAVVTHPQGRADGSSARPAT
jgi:hypothetical protein